MTRTATRSLQAIALLFPLWASAETPNAVPERPFVSQTTREAVRSDLVAYKRSGVNPYFLGFNPLRTFRSTASAGELKAEYMASRESVRQATGEAGQATPYGTPRLARASFNPFHTTFLER